MKKAMSTKQLMTPKVYKMNKSPIIISKRSSSSSSRAKLSHFNHHSSFLPNRKSNKRKLLPFKHMKTPTVSSTQTTKHPFSTTTTMSSPQSQPSSPKDYQKQAQNIKLIDQNTQDKVITSINPVQGQLLLKDPFIFASHHVDYYPPGNDKMQPTRPPTKEKPYGMYHSESGVPGFPAHPHTGFETITVVERGTVDHFDSLGNSGRYGGGDIQWLSTGNGIEHCEMFPLVNKEKDNTLELFQIWFNSAPLDKRQDPAYRMMWREDINHVYEEDYNGLKSDVRVIAGLFKGKESLEPPPNSWAHNPENKVNLFLIEMEPGATLTIPSTSAISNRFCYVYGGEGIHIANKTIPFKNIVEMKAGYDIHITNTANKRANIMWLEGEPIGATVAQRGPFVMNTNEELHHAFERYYENRFNQKWPWGTSSPVFPPQHPRCSSTNNGESEYPEGNHNKQE